MAEFAPIAPPHLYPKMLAQGYLGTYRLFLAQEVVEDPEAHSVHVRLGSSKTILDNGTIELGHPVSVEMMEEAVKICRPNVIVLPDIIGDADGTIRESVMALKDYRRLALLYSCSLMVVPQGQNLNEFISCASTLIHVTNADWIGVPRWIANKWGSRRDALFTLHAIFPHRTLHMLGFSNNLLDDITCARMPFVRGIDSSLPVLVGALGGDRAQEDSNIQKYLGEAILRPTRELVGWNSLEWNQAMADNIDKVREWLTVPQ